MSVLRDECRHERLRFGSGCYYLFCDDCYQKWVAVKIDADEPDHTCNEGAGGSLSGEPRTKP